MVPVGAEEERGGDLAVRRHMHEGRVLHGEALSDERTNLLARSRRDAKRHQLVTNEDRLDWPVDGPHEKHGRRGNDRCAKEVDHFRILHREVPRISPPNCHVVCPE